MGLDYCVWWRGRHCSVPTEGLPSPPQHMHSGRGKDTGPWCDAGESLDAIFVIGFFVQKVKCSLWFRDNCGLGG